MNKCYQFAALFLLDLLNVIDCQWPLTISGGNVNMTLSVTDLDLRMNFTIDKSSLSSSQTTYTSCTFTISLVDNIKPPKTAKLALKCTNHDVLCPIVSVPTTKYEWSSWTDCAMSNGKGMTYRFQNIICTDDTSNCCLPKNISLIDKQDCRPNTVYSTPQGSSQEICKDDGKRYTLIEFILLAFGCFLVGVVLTALIFILYMKRKQQGCFSINFKEAQVDSKQLSGQDVQFLAENVAVKKYHPKKPESADSKNENKSDETQYQSLSSNRIDNDQQPYDELQLKGTRSDHYGNEPSSGRLKQTGNDEKTDSVTNLQHETEGANTISRDSDLDGHNYFILRSENISPESKTRNQVRPETYAEVGDEVRDSTLETQGEQSDAVHDYFVLEHFEH